MRGETQLKSAHWPPLASLDGNREKSLRRETKNSEAWPRRGLTVNRSESSSGALCIRTKEQSDDTKEPFLLVLGCLGKSHAL
jgi:hypothetical protein